jgi:hypothetical protein
LSTAPCGPRWPAAGLPPKKISRIFNSRRVPCPTPRTSTAGSSYAGAQDGDSHQIGYELQIRNRLGR